MQHPDSYRTSELEVASFLKARGHKLLRAIPAGKLVEFAFDTDAASDVDAYISGATIPAREVFEAHRSLRALIQQVKQHNQNRSEINTWYNRTQQ
jgi:hypothetical protein